jgi:S-adenosylmethionine:tRNA ribosyltransferase-isomerase
MISEIKIDDYSYDLPQDRIAKYPVDIRDQSKLLFLNKGKISHHIFSDLSNLLPSNTFLVFNNTRVIPARLYFYRESGAQIEVFLLNPMFPSDVISETMEAKNCVIWECAIGNKKKWKPKEMLTNTFVVEGIDLTISISWEDYDLNLVKFEWKGNTSFAGILNSFGSIPLPPYLNREAEIRDVVDYQTIYSENDGAVAAPTAGLHFTERVFKTLDEKNIQRSFITLHVGAGTFMPVKVKNALEHPMHGEQIVFTQKFIIELLKNSSNVIPIGTTSMRSLESLYWFGVKLILNRGEDTIFFIEKLFPYTTENEISLTDSLNAVLIYMQKNNLTELVGNTEIMIFPSYIFRICKGIVTNFHQPNSTLLLLVAALIGEQRWKEIYNEALNNNYRFLSFGDSSLLIP